MESVPGGAKSEPGGDGMEWVHGGEGPRGARTPGAGLPRGGGRSLDGAVQGMGAGLSGAGPLWARLQRGGGRSLEGLQTDRGGDSRGGASKDCEATGAGPSGAGLQRGGDSRRGAGPTGARSQGRVLPSGGRRAPWGRRARKLCASSASLACSSCARRARALSSSELLDVLR